MPELFLDVVHHSLNGADSTMGQISADGPHAFWIKGPMLGELRCAAVESAKDARITGRLYRLTEPMGVELGVGMDYDDFDRVDRWWGRILTLRFPNAEQVTIDATKGDEGRRRQGEQFIDKVLDKIAG